MKRNENLPLNLIEKMNARVSLVVSLVVLAVICIVFNRMDYVMVRKPAEEAARAEQDAKEAEEQSRTSEAATTVKSVSVVAVGDNLVQGALIDSGQSGSGQWNYNHLYTQIAPRIQAADLAIVNQETPFAASHDLVSGYYPYASPVEVGDALVSAGFNVVSSATEYMASSGQDALASTVQYWQQNHPQVQVPGIRGASETSSVRVVEINQIRIALLDFVIPISGMTVDVSSVSYEEEDDGGYYDEEEGVYYAYDPETDEYYEADPPSRPVSSAAPSEGAGYVLDTFDTERVAAMITDAKSRSDCIIFCAHWGRNGETMPTEYQKEWANFLLAQGVDVVLGSFPHAISPYCTMEDRQGHKMLIYFSLGNFISTGESLKELLGGMASFTIQKTIYGSKSEISIINPDLEPLVMHYDYDGGEYGVYPLSSYTDFLANSHSVKSYFDQDFSLSLLNAKWDEILSMGITPTEKNSQLSWTFDSEGNAYDQTGNYAEDSDSVSSSQYYSGLPASSSESEDEEYDGSGEDYDDDDEGDYYSEDDSYEESEDGSYEGSEDEGYEEDYGDEGYDEEY